MSALAEYPRFSLTGHHEITVLNTIAPLLKLTSIKFDQDLAPDMIFYPVSMVTFKRFRGLQIRSSIAESSL